MLEIPIMNEEQFVEGITASITFPLVILYFKDKHWNYIVYMMIAWFVTWICRKTSVNIYHMVKDTYKFKNKTFHLIVPFI